MYNFDKAHIQGSVFVLWLVMIIQNIFKVLHYQFLAQRDRLVSMYKSNVSREIV
jgi:hypothetical protein